MPVNITDKFCNVCSVDVHTEIIVSAMAAKLKKMIIFGELLGEAVTELCPISSVVLSGHFMSVTDSSHDSICGACG